MGLCEEVKMVIGSWIVIGGLGLFFFLLNWFMVSYWKRFDKKEKERQRLFDLAMEQCLKDGTFDRGMFIMKWPKELE